jgi:hypothetical protein
MSGVNMEPVAGKVLLLILKMFRAQNVRLTFPTISSRQVRIAGYRQMTYWRYFISTIRA